MSSFCCMLMGPRVATVRTWVSPRWKRPVPCVRGRMPTSQEIGRSSSRSRPSARLPSLRIRSRSVFLTTASSAVESWSAVNSSPKRSLSSARRARRPSCRSSLTAASMSSTRLLKKSATAVWTAGSTSFALTAIFGRLSSLIIRSWAAISFWFSSWARRTASRKTASVTPLAPASTMITFSRVEETTRSSSLSFSSV